MLRIKNVKYNLHGLNVHLGIRYHLNVALVSLIKLLDSLLVSCTPPYFRGESAALKKSRVSGITG